MKTPLLHLIAAAAAIGVLATVALSLENNTSPPKQAETSSEPAADISFYEEGDWYRYAVAPSYSLPGIKGKLDLSNTLFESDSWVKFSGSYGRSYFTKQRYKLYDGDEASSNIIKNDITASNEMRLLVTGHVGNRLNVFIDHDSSRKRQDENCYSMKYRAVDDNEVIREINAGDIDVSVAGSKYAFYDGGSEKSLGIDSTIRKGNLSLKGFLSVSKGEEELERFKGGASSASSSVADYQYVKNTRFQLEPYLRYDGVTKPGLVTYSLITYTSAPSDPLSYSPYAVNLEPGSVEIWLDPQTTVANINAVSFTPDGGSYIKLAEGTEYKVNYLTGEITFIRSISSQSRIVAGYRLAGGASSSDPAVLTNLITGKNAVYIKYGTSIDEDPDHDGISNGDTNGDGKINHDVYEIRSHYVIGDKNLKPENFNYTLYNVTKTATAAQKRKLGRYTVNYTEGTLTYYLREPFRALLSSSSASAIYCQTGTDLYEVSEYSQKFEYTREARSFQLKHLNVVQGSVSVSVNDSLLSPSLYSVNSASGTVDFVNANNPVVTDSTVIEIRYQYAQSEFSSRGFLAGLRSDYRINEMLSIGGTTLYRRSNATEVVPEQGNEPTQNIVFEGDAKFTAGESKFGKVASALTGGSIDTLPLSFKGYAEYAHSIYDVNTFGKMLVDDMEGDTDEAVVSLSERDWILSSMPSGMHQADRASLLYKYYRSLSSLSTLHDFSFTPYYIPYSAKAGPYNVCDGHIAYSSSDRNTARRSLVFEADFSSGKTASAATRINGGTETDLSSLQYVEIWYRSTGGSGTVNMSLDIGRISEDADGTGSLKTEDVNRNGYLDRDLSNGIDEDVGYAFTPSGNLSTRVGNGPGLNSVTVGDGTLTTEDLNYNGTLDTTEKTVSFPGNYAWKDSDTAFSPLSINLSDTAWKKVRIFLKRKNLTETELYNLRHTIALRLNLTSTTASKAVICIDSLRIVSSRWKDVYINGVSNEDTEKLKINLVDTIDDAEYRANSFMCQERSEYTSLYGDRTDSEINDEKESALSLTYSLSGETASVTRHFTKALDLRRYHTLSLWLNPREVTSGDVLRFYCSTSTGDYSWYDIPLTWNGGWRKVTLKLDSGSKGNVAVTGTAGVPDRGSVRMLKAEILGGTGRLWINTILAADPYTLTGDAYWVEGTVNVTRPLYVTDAGTEVAKDLSFTAVRKFHSGDYNSPGRSDLGMNDDAGELRTDVELLPGWRNTLSAAFRKSRVDSFDPSYTDSERGRTDRDSFSFISSYRRNDPFTPFLQFSYYGENVSKRRDEYVSDSRVTEKTSSETHSPSLVYEQSIRDPFDGILKIRSFFDNTFRSSTVSHVSADGSALSEEDTISHFHEAWQKNSIDCALDYSYGKVFLSPQCRIYSNEVVSRSSSGVMTGSILEKVGGGFHFPFAPVNDSKTVERAADYTFSWGLRDFPACGLSDMLTFSYAQNGFSDYTESEKNEYKGFTRDHSSSAAASRIVTVPFQFQSPLFGFMRFVNLNWSRKMNFDESGVPFEREGGNFYGEKYGIQRSFGGLAPEILDFYNYSPWHFFMGNGNCAHARDHLYSRMNTQLTAGNSAVSAYSNALRMTEDTGISTGFVFKGITLNTGGSIHQVTERESVSALPGQQMTLSASCDAGFDLMDIFSFGFFRPNDGKNSFHGARFSIGYLFSRTMLFTSNIREDSHQPSAGILFQWGRSTFSTNFGIDLRHRKTHDFISADESERSGSDDLYYAAMTHEKVNERSTGYTFKTRYETDVTPIYRFFLLYYELTGIPIFSLEYSLLLNRYDYKNSVAPEPYDQHLLTAKLDFDLHKNVKGGVTGQMALERWYNRETHGLYREVISYDVEFNVKIMF